MNAMYVIIKKALIDCKCAYAKRKMKVKEMYIKLFDERLTKA